MTETTTPAGRISELIDLERFKVYQTGLYGNSLAIGTDSTLIVNTVNLPSNGNENPYKERFSDSITLDIGGDGESLHENLKSLEFSDSSSRISTLLWLTDEVICVGFESGLLQGFSITNGSNGKISEIFQFKGGNSIVSSLKLFEDRGMRKLWILYEEGLLLMIPLNDVVSGKFNDCIGFQLTGQEACNDFTLYYRLSTNVNYWEDYDVSLQSYHIRCFVVGYESTISIYDLDMPLIYHEINNIMEKEKAASASYFKSFYSLYNAAMGSSNPSSSSAGTANSSGVGDDRSVKTWNRARILTLQPMLQFFDTKRRILRLSVDPFHTLIATADALGRVELYDINADCFIRLWKGLRDASLGWHIDEEDTTALFSSLPASRGGVGASNLGKEVGGIGSGGTSSSGAPGQTIEINESRMSEIARTALQLVIYAPLLGLVSIYKMKNGPCLRVIPIGMNCKLTPIASSFIQSDRSIQTILPIAYETESSSFTMISLNSKFQSDTELSYLADLIDALEFDSPDHHHRQPLSPASVPSTPLSGGEPSLSELGVRHSDMRTSMREAVERGRKIRPPVHFLNNELQKYLYLLSAETTKIGGVGTGGVGTSGMTKLTSQEVEKLENKIIALLKQQTSLFSLIPMVQLIENFELNGFSLSPSAASNPTAASKTDKSATTTTTPSPRNQRVANKSLPQGEESIGWIRVNAINKRRFSLAFHTSLTQVVKDQLSAEESTLKATVPHIYHRINDEIDARTKLLSVYVSLGEIDSGSSGTGGGLGRRPSQGTSSSSSTTIHQSALQTLSISALKEDASHACKANAFRSESLCWVLRHLKKMEHRQKTSTGKAPTSSGSSNGNSGDRTGQGSSHASTYLDSSINDKLSLSPRPPLFNQLPSRNRTASQLGATPFSSPTGLANSSAAGGGNGLISTPGGMTGAGTGSFTTPVRNGSQYHHRRASFSLTPPHLTTSTDVTLRKLIENNTRNSFTSPTVDVVVSPFNVSGIPQDLGANSNGGLEFAVMNFSIFRALHILDGNRDLYLVLNLIRSWLECERGNFSYRDANFDHAHLPQFHQSGGSIYQCFQSSIAMKAGNFSEIVKMVQNHLMTTSNSPPAPTPTSSINSLLQFAYSSNVIAQPIQATSKATSALFPVSTQASATPDPTISTATPASYYQIHPNVIYPLLSLVFKCLVYGDLTTLHSFYNAMKYESSALSGIEGLRDFLPCFLEYLCKQSSVIIVQDLLGRNISTSPIQRLLRDHLLTFQDLLSRYKQYKLKIKELTSATGSSEIGDDSSKSKSLKEEEKLLMEETGLEYAELRLMDQLRLDVVNEFTTSEITTQNIEDVTAYLPSFDEFVRHIFRPVWKYCRLHNDLEIMMSFASVIADTLHIVNDQIERRTYGADQMKKTIQGWENLIREIRVVLLLKSRIYADKVVPASYTIQSLAMGELSLYQILAYDTLEFTHRVDQSQEHEDRCRELYKRRVAGVDISMQDSSVLSQAKDGSGGKGSEVLVAWGSIADKRWRDIISLAINEDTAEEEEDRFLYAQTILDTPPPSSLYPSGLPSASASANNTTGDKRGKSKRRKPLLLYFPEHNHRVFLGAYRAIILAQRWNEKIDSMERLVIVMEHLFEIPILWRSIVALEIYSVYIFPVIVTLMNLEEDKDQVMMNHSAISTARKEQLLNIMAEKSLLESFVRCSVELLNYVLEVASTSNIVPAGNTSASLSNPPTTAAVAFDAMTNELLLSTTAGLKSQVTHNNSNAESESSNVVYDLNEVKNYYHYSYCSDDFITNNEEIFKDENPVNIWPKKYDLKLVLLHYEYYFHSRYQTSAPNTSSNKTAAGVGGIGAAVTGNEGSGSNKIRRQYYIWNNKYQLFYHISILYVTQLRFTCGLRGLKPSQLLGSNILDLINESSYYDDYVAQQIDWKKMRMNRYYDYGMINIRLEFLEQCFLRSDAIATFSLKIIYNLSKLWDFETDIIYLIHLKSLLSKGDIDNEMEGIIAKCSDVNLVSDFLLQLLRIKMGLLILQIEKYAVFSPLIVMFDPEAMEWAKYSIRPLQSSSFTGTTSNPASVSPSYSTLSASLSNLSPLLTNDAPVLMNSTVTSSSYYGMSGGGNYTAAFASGPPGSSAASNTNFVKIILKDILLIKRIVTQVQHLLLNLPLGKGGVPGDASVNNTQYYCDKYRLFRSCFLDYATATPANTSSVPPVKGLSGSGGVGSGAGSGTGTGKVVVQFSWNDRKRSCEWLLALCNVISQLQATTNVYSSPNVSHTASPSKVKKPAPTK